MNEKRASPFFGVRFSIVEFIRHRPDSTVSGAWGFESPLFISL
jgi:hypothetical protein